MGRHSAPKRAGQSKQATVGRAAAVLAGAGLALGGGAAAASAAPAPGQEPVEPKVALSVIDLRTGMETLKNTVGYTAGPVGALKPNPLAGTGVDPTDNGVGTQVSDFRPVTTQTLTDPLTQAETVNALPAVGQVTGLLGGLAPAPAA
ncbi:hypothetical protein [Streptomyces sp. MJP52]|uniref:hypothetical protein n=1 Tax=Streptomyces sp. MJP52 TaxID=2940555 RepID=UPI002473160E|nr:hypothetical protein [Streptomyces sp. MJP52]MDH6225361.1 hypothetical protein [Streptomyces sp. MJP52]